MACAPPLARAARVPAWSDGGLEALKWLALASMLLDHVGRFGLGLGTDGWAFAGGRLAFPLFAFVLGWNLARPGDRAARCARAAVRLALWCAVSVAPSVLMRGNAGTLNVLATLGLGALVCWLFAAAPGAGLGGVLLALAAVAAQWVEFGLAGALLVPMVYLWRTGASAGGPLLAALLLACVAWLNAGAGGWPAWLGTLTAVPAAALARVLPLRVPRTGRLFYGFYPAHQALVAGWRALA